MADSWSSDWDEIRLSTFGAAHDERLALLDGIRDLHAEVARLSLPLDVPGAAQMRHERESLLGLLEGYLVSRLEAGDRPLLAVIGGPTGAGKSTLVNSLIGASVTSAGVLRPTTRTPVLLYNPQDERALVSQAFLPGLEMSVLRREPHHGEHGQFATAADLPAHPDPQPARRLQLIARPEVPRGLALLDSPDLDSFLSTNRELAAELLGVADLWILVTTGTEYADEVPWALLDGAAERRITLAAVLNRMRPDETSLVRRHLAEMLIARGLPQTPVFSIPELVLVDGRIPYTYVAQLSNWLAQQAGVEGLRDSYLDRAMRSTLDQVLLSVRRLIDAAADQVVADRRLRVDLKAIFSQVREDIREDLTSRWPDDASGTPGGLPSSRRTAADGSADG